MTENPTGKCIRSLVWLLALLALPTVLRLRAQLIPLQGPLLAAAPADHDRILLYDVGSGARRDLAFGDGWHLVWDFSPDGCRVLFTLGDSLARLYSARLDGSDRRELAQYAAPAGDWGIWAPRWSPDGTRIAFTLIQGAPRANGVQDHRIAWVEAAGGPVQFYSAGGDEHEPEWSPDGRWLAYIAFSQRVPGADISATAAPTPQGQTGPLLREADLWIVSADGTIRHRLTDFPTGSVRAPRWSPDGQLISFIYSPSPGNDQFWMIAAQPGAIPTQLSSRWSLALATTWLPDSSAFLAAVRDFRDAPGQFLWRIPLVGLADRDATLYLADQALNHADYPRFSADGRWLALRSAYALALVDAASGAWTLLDDAFLGNTPPVWSPAGFRGEASC